MDVVTERERLAAAATEAMRLLRARWTDQAELDAVVTVQSELGFLRAELARRDTTIAAVRKLAEDLQVEDVTGGMTDAGSLWPSEVLELLSAPVEAGAPAGAVNIVGGTHTDPGNTELDDAIEVIVGDYVADTLVRTDLAKRVLAEVVKRTGLGVYDKPLPGAPAEPLSDLSNDPRREAARQELADALAAVDGDFDDRYLRMADALQSRYWTAEPTTED